MTVIIINPNSTKSMTEAMTRAAQDAVPELHFEGWTSHAGPAAIQGAEDGIRATPHLLELVRNADEQGADGIIIGCFDDTALQQAASVAACPVIGIGQAAYHFAALRHWRFSVVTTLAVSVPVIQKNIDTLGLTRLLAKVRASNVPVLALENDRDASEAAILEEAQRAESEDRVDAIVLGCAGMATLSKSVRDVITCDVVDPVVVAATCMKWLT